MDDFEIASDADSGTTVTMKKWRFRDELAGYARSAAGVPERAAREPVEWGVATRCRRGEATSGDLAVVTLLPEGVLVAGIDGLGHGAEAARAARRAAEVVRESRGRDLVLLVERCHVALQRHARGGDQPGLRLHLRSAG